MSNPGISWEIDTRGFTEFANALAQMSGQTFEHVLTDQAGKVIELAARRTARLAPSAAEIDTSVSFKNRNLRTTSRGFTAAAGFSGRSGAGRTGVPVIVGKKNGAILFVDESNFDYSRGRKRFPTKKINGNRTFHQMNSPFRRWSDERWARYQAALAVLQAKRINPAAAKKARGLAAHSFYQMAEDLALAVDVPNYIKNARPANGRSYKNGTARKITRGAAFFIELVNDYPALADPSITRGKVDGRAIFQEAIDRRLRAFEIETAKGVFADIKTRAQRYPGIFVNAA